MASRDPITNGKDFNFFTKVNVSNAVFAESSDVIFNFRGQFSFSLINEGSGIVEYSFNGSVLHGDMKPGSPSEALFFDNRRVSKIWFRALSGTNTIRIEAWAV
jgi:hypothetical protein